MYRFISWFLFFIFLGLTNYLFSDECNILDPKCSTIYQDMNHPLSHYFISSSHNTYVLPLYEFSDFPRRLGNHSQRKSELKGGRLVW